MKPKQQIKDSLEEMYFHCLLAINFSLNDAGFVLDLLIHLSTRANEGNLPCRFKAYERFLNHPHVEPRLSEMLAELFLQPNFDLVNITLFAGKCYRDSILIPPENPVLRTR